MKMHFVLQNSERDQSSHADQFYMYRVQENICEVVSHQRYILNHNQNSHQSSIKQIKNILWILLEINNCFIYDIQY